MADDGKVYFASDFHLGLNAPHESSVCREKKIVSWLDMIHDPLNELYLVGDIFDYWFEYKSVIPKGFTRFLGKIAEMCDDEMKVYFFTGNHDMWMFRYLKEELGVPIIRTPLIKKIGTKQFYIAHGDGLGTGDYRYKIIKTIFSNPYCQWMFERIHPNLGIELMKYGSRLSRNQIEESEFKGLDKERLIRYTQNLSEIEDIDFFILGHRHLPIAITLSNGTSQYINLGDWIRYRSYAEYYRDHMFLKFFENEELRFLP